MLRYKEQIDPFFHFPLTCKPRWLRLQRGGSLTLQAAPSPHEGSQSGVIYLGTSAAYFIFCIMDEHLMHEHLQKALWMS